MKREKININKKGRKVEFNEFKEFINHNIHIIQNNNINLENVETVDNCCCGYSKEKK